MKAQSPSQTKTKLVHLVSLLVRKDICRLIYWGQQTSSQNFFSNELLSLVISSENRPYRTPSFSSCQQLILQAHSQKQLSRSVTYLDF